MEMNQDLRPGDSQSDRDNLTRRLEEQAELSKKVLAKELQEQNVRELQRIKNLQSNRFASLAFALLGIILALASFIYTQRNIAWLEPLIDHYGITILGLLLSLVSISFYFNSTKRVADVDFLRRAIRENENTLNPQDAWPFPTGKKKEDIQANFKSTIKSMTAVLQAQAETYDEKASTLLDKGIFYAAIGIVFFLISIIAWQVVFFFSEFKTAHIFGIASCASLFIAIEVISAWFLKQYRNFTDSSTELLKIKSIFDKFLLLKLACEETADSDLHKHLAGALGRDISWPSRPDRGNSTNLDIKNLNEIISIIQKITKENKSDENKP